MPLLDEVPSPDASLMSPPERVVLRPELKDSVGPAPLVPLPALTLKVPLRPMVASPEPMQSMPEFPFTDDPELKAR